ncbi:hypothetical protein [Vibrio parahaemolyticus]|uniref:hypothetical protein n=1 Tax=Vibrio parahaemolyticus TaxID=670 RepID=UPI00111E953F|nr:hypothetical protein [Vibrio parahaemolyticus]MBE3691564.1 hypothetical protein [Vibrio parahaemolyticus]MBE3700884.1 hypothetical protein [Vibrio parahaemolyticus]MBE3756353.1 hypothetical protein [Vibrio parahaemolyticus]MBE3779932.1 hypothetical protein [Vibrio parahaemolyticus]MBE3793793.1 hypothetical protein [Vibrio parahaemolyticus]
MKKVLLLLTVLSLPTLLTGCGDSDPDHARKVRCTELQGIASDGFRGKIPKEDYIKATDEWEKLKCHRSDVIQG